MMTVDLYYPKSIVVDPPLATHGLYSGGYPRGAVVHYTAGAPGLGALEEARQQGYTYLLIDETGAVHQGFPLNEWGYHAGDSYWPILGQHVSMHLVGIEIVCAGLVTPDGSGNFKTCWGGHVEQDQVRVVVDRENQVGGAYQIYTEAQEASLLDLLVWLKLNGPDVFDTSLVLGHDEVSPGRKTDPGGSLSMTMPALRDRLRVAIVGSVI
jgi:N-acetyl-anhydromuramyl-L-alanine amidase AmpD